MTPDKWRDEAQEVLVKLQGFCDCTEGWPKKLEVVSEALSRAYREGLEAAKEHCDHYDKVGGCPKDHTMNRKML